MRKIKVWIQTNIADSKCSDEFEVDEEATDEEIEEIAKDVIWNMAEWNWEPIP